MNTVKLYDLKRGDKFTVVDTKIPPGSPHIYSYEVLTLHNIDGMYSYCTREDGTVVHPAAFSNVVKERN